MGLGLNRFILELIFWGVSAVGGGGGGGGGIHYPYTQQHLSITALMSAARSVDGADRWIAHNVYTTYGPTEQY